MATPERYSVLRFLAYKHLPEHLQANSKPFMDLAEHILATCPDDAEVSVALRNIREAKDCVVGLLAVQPKQ